MKYEKQSSVGWKTMGRALTKWNVDGFWKSHRPGEVLLWGKAFVSLVFLQIPMDSH